jgi:hypothetical protein
MTTAAAEAMAAVHAAAATLQERHLHWVVNASLRHFNDAIAKGEREIARHERFREEAPRGWSIIDESRDERLAALRDALVQQRKILTFLLALSRALSIASAEAFAEELRRSGFGFGRSSRRG